MNKKWIALALLFVVLVGVITYFNYDRIEEYIENKNWQLADSIATIQTDDISQIVAGKSLITLTKSSIDFYTNSNKIENTISVTTNEIVTDAAGDYTVVADKTLGNIYLMKDVTKVWETKVTGSVLGVVVNKNGYVAVIYSQPGYKSIIKVLKANGEEMFTTFLASTYALDVAIADNNKNLAVIEVDTDGIKLISKIKLLEIDGTGENKVDTLYEESNCLVLDIEYKNANELLLLKDNGVALIDSEKNVKELLKYSYSDVAYSTIENAKNIVVVRKIATGIFGSESVVEIYENETKKEYKLSSTPQSVHVQNKIIALNMGNEVIFVGTNGNLIKRYTLGGQLKDIKLYDNGNFAALVFRNKVELIKI